MEILNNVKISQGTILFASINKKVKNFNTELYTIKVEVNEEIKKELEGIKNAVREAVKTEKEIILPTYTDKENREVLTLSTFYEVDKTYYKKEILTCATIVDVHIKEKEDKIYVNLYLKAVIS